MHQRNWHKSQGRESVNSEGGITVWNVFDNVKTTTKTPEALMAEINAAISNLEYDRTAAYLESPISPEDEEPSANSRSQYDVRIADGAYKAGCKALTIGKLDEALHSLNVSLSKCPPEKSSAVAKIQSLISLTSQQIQIRSSNCQEISED
ncbi:uncharacterized protein E5676_scaffold134G003530 [Cucumis melo var. makuwa]|uniref:Uncharacterized protein n=2 Tax=Cucumis melo TaxID=3656 RepID=A0A5A7VF87_CUCMM|nr:uncharacterized protein E6C27_scaffold255G00720 [Cucumis melo var. makuwa]TYK20216.1 uncharacterized protein E5676_scaffold134G003530 [Cucumis melo var. makuwa]